jgi:hypothetical protein
VRWVLALGEGAKNAVGDWREGGVQDDGRFRLGHAAYVSDVHRLVNAYVSTSWIDLAVNNPLARVDTACILRGMHTTTNASKVRALLPGRQVELSRGNGFRVLAERSGDGKTLRIVRENRDGFVVIKAERF